ncbi:MAG: carbohydrate ABC transporter permease [Acidimicrobiales bacterium]
MTERRRHRSAWRRWINGVNIATLAIVIIIVAPIYWMLASSLKPPLAIARAPSSALPSPFTVSNYYHAFVHYDFGIYIRNSVIVASVATILVLGLGTFAGYALGRLPMRGKFHILLTLLMISVFPEIAVIAPLFLIMRELGWLNSFQALIVPYTAFNLPFAIWILRNYFLRIPKEMEEVSEIDGASPSRTLLRVVLPQATPGLFTAGVFTFTACWSEFLMALSFNTEPSFRTIPVGIALFGTEFITPYGTLFAASIVATLPIAILVLIFRKSVVSGLTSGAVKG